MLTSAYIHIPFCKRLCPYCDFFVLVEKSGQRQKLLQRLQQEIAEDPNPATNLKTVHFGGGTPSELTANEIRHLLEALSSRFGIADDAEIALEANPEDLETDHLEQLAAVGVTRLSLGIQSFDAEALQWLGRSHSVQQARRAAQQAAIAEFHSFSVDLIHGVPCLDLERSLDSVRLAIELGAPHVSHYGLTYHEETRLGRKLAAGRVQPMDEDLEADVFEAAVQLLLQAGFEHYEISNFARPGHRSRHNLACWKGEGYLAFGPSAVGFTQGQRWKNPASLAAWLAGAPRELETVTPSTSEIESVIAGLRLVQEGLSRTAFHQRHGRDIQEAFPKALERGLELGLLELDKQRLRLANLRAILLYDSVIELFIASRD